MSNPEIKFSHHQGNKTFTNAGKSVLSDTFLLGAMALTSKERIDNHQVTYQYPTDQEGIEILQIKADQLASGISDSIRALGIITTYVEASEVEDELNTIGWLICGLSEVMQMALQESVQLRKSEPLITKENTND